MGEGSISGLPVYRAGERLDKGGETVWLGIIQMLSEINIPQSLKQQLPCEKIVSNSGSNGQVNIVPYVTGHFKRRAGIVFEDPKCFFCGNCHATE